MKLHANRTGSGQRQQSGEEGVRRMNATVHTTISGPQIAVTHFLSLLLWQGHGMGKRREGSTGRWWTGCRAEMQAGGSTCAMIVWLMRDFLIRNTVYHICTPLPALQQLAL